MNQRKPSLHLNRPEIERLLSAWERARDIGSPLDTFVSVRRNAIEAMPPEQRSDAWALLRQQLLVRMGRLKIVPTMIWARESLDASGRGEHCHFLIHAGDRRGALAKALTTWLKHEIDVAEARQAVSVGRNRTVMSIVHYIVKQASPEAAHLVNITRRKGGLIIGKRAGMTNNLQSPPTDPPACAIRAVHSISII